MAVKTPSSVLRESNGSLTILKATFSDIDDQDTWASGIEGQVWGKWFNVTGNLSSGSSTAVSESSGTFTFYTADAQSNVAGELYVLMRG